MLGRVVRWLILTVTFVPIQAGGASGAGVTISVVDDNRHGVFSEIFAEDGSTPIPIGKTKEDGTQTYPDYRCDINRPLMAKPMDTTIYFNSNQEPCNSPLHFLVHTRITPTGFAFSGIEKDIVFQDGSSGQISVRTTMDIAAKAGIAVADRPAQGDTCELNYTLSGYRSVFKLGAEGWTPVVQSEEPGMRFVDFSDAELKSLVTDPKVEWKQYHPIIRKNDRGIDVMVPTNCSSVGSQATKLGDLIKNTYGDKMRSGKWKGVEDFKYLK